MAVTGYPIRNQGVVWRDIAGEVVIAERDNSTVSILNKTASLIWSLADGTKQVEDMVIAICNRFEVTTEEAWADTEEFCLELLEAGLVSFNGNSPGTQEA